jgi:hypothetical protein
MCDTKTTIADKLEHKKAEEISEKLEKNSKAGKLPYALSILQLSGGMPKST